MGLLTDERRQRTVVLALARWQGLLVVVLVVCGGLASLGLVCYENGINEAMHQQENSLITGAAAPTVSHEHAKAEKTLAKSLATNMSIGHIADELQRRGLHPTLQTFHTSSPSPPTQEGTNIYCVIKSSRGDGTEAIVLHAPIESDTNANTHGIASAITLGANIAGQPFWAKDVVLLFTTHGHEGASAWISAYFDGTLPLPVTSTIESGLTLEAEGATFRSVHLDLHGINGQMPNMDLVMVLKASRLPISVAHEPLHARPVFETQLRTFANSLLQQASCLPTGLHAALLNENIPIFTVRTVPSSSSSSGAVERRSMSQLGKYDILQYMQLVEGALRSMNNMGQRFNLSFTYYFVLAGNRFVSIGRYLPGSGAALCAVLLRVMVAWLRLGGDLSEEAEEQTGDGGKEGDDDDDDDKRGNRDEGVSHGAAANAKTMQQRRQQPEAAAAQHTRPLQLQERRRRLVLTELPWSGRSRASVARAALLCVGGLVLPLAAAAARHPHASTTVATELEERLHAWVESSAGVDGAMAQVAVLLISTALMCVTSLVGIAIASALTSPRKGGRTNGENAGRAGVEGEEEVWFALSIVLLLLSGLLCVAVMIVNFGLFLAVFTLLCVPLLLLPSTPPHQRVCCHEASTIRRAVHRSARLFTRCVVVAAHPLVLFAALGALMPHTMAGVYGQARSLAAVGVWLQPLVVGVWTPLSTLTCLVAVRDTQ